MKKYILFAFSLLAILEASVAQPGYQGKKLSVQANILLLPAIKNATYHNTPAFTSLNSTKEVHVDYVISRRNTFGLTYRNSRTSTLRNYDADISTIPSIKVHSNAVGLRYRIFKRRSGNLAPLGKHTTFGLQLMFNHTDDIKNRTEPAHFTTYALTIGKGRSKIFFDRLILNYGIELSHVFTGFSKEGLKGATYYYKDDVQTMAQYRMWRHSLVNVKMGIGFLAL